jgi:insulysin
MFYQVTFPTVLRKSPLSQLWYKPDMLFSTPKVHIIIDFHCPLSSHSPEAVVATELFVDLLVDYLNAYGKQESVNLVYFYIFPCITINLESTADFKFMYTIFFFAAYDAQIAGLFYSIYVTSAGFQVFLVTMTYIFSAAVLS